MGPLKFLVEQWETLVAIAGAVALVMRKLHQLQGKVDAMTDTSVTGILSAVAGNIRTITEQTDPKKLHTLDIMFAHGVYVSIPVVIGMTYSPWPGMDLTGIASTEIETTYSLKTVQPVALVRHSHEERESVMVLTGSMTDLDSGRVYRRGEAWDIEPGMDHRVYFEAPGVFVATIQPPLPHAAERPVNVDRMHELATMT